MKKYMAKKWTQSFINCKNYSVSLNFSVKEK